MRLHFVLRPVALAIAMAGAVGAQSPTFQFRANGISVRIRFGSDSLAQLGPQLQATLTGGIERYHVLFGGPPRNADGTPSDTLAVNVVADRFGGGDSDPGFIQLLMGPRPAFGFYEWRYTLLHELFHLWSAESFRYAGQREQWFNEGVAEFYALQTAARLGILDGFEALRLAATAVGFYESAADRARLSVAEAGTRKAQQYFLVYDGGWTAALVLDRDLRGRTRNTKSLDDLMRWMYATFDRRHTYTTVDVARGLRMTSGIDYEPWFVRHITGTSPLPTATLNLGENARLLQARLAGFAQAPPPDSLLLQSLGVVR